MTRWVDLVATLLLLFGGMLSALDSIVVDHYEMAPLAMGLALLLIHHGRRQPLRYLYLLLLLVLLRVILKGDERFLSSEITGNDYTLIVLGFAASYQLPAAFWRVQLPLFAIFIPLAALLSYLLRAGPETAERFNAGTLSINQTSFLLGCCLILSLCFLWNSATRKRESSLRWLLTISWSGLTLILLFLGNATGSRSGQALPLVMFVAMLTWAHRHQVWERVRIPRISSSIRGLGVKVLGAALMAAGAMAGLRAMYADPDTMVSDLHRLYLLRCYLQAPFSGRNRLVYGMGVTKASETLCKDIGLVKDTSHAHNIFAQIAGDNGFFAFLTIACIAGWFLVQALQKAQAINHPIVFASSCLFVYIFIVLQLEGGWGKVTFLQVLIGLSMGAITMEAAKPSSA
jgi:hypothetical protein